MSETQKEKLMSDLRIVISDAEELLKMTADEAGESAAGLRHRVRQRMNQATAELMQMQVAALARARAAGQATDEFVHENPWKAIGLGLGMGILIGALITRR